MSKLPRVLVFDLDGCTWWPEMYHLWGGGGSPFKALANGNVKDRAGTEVKIMADLRSILKEVKTEAKWAGTRVAVASSCDEPSWARECIRMIKLDESLGLGDVFEPSLTEIYKSSKSAHLREISAKSNLNLSDMMFFDNEWGNCQTVAKIGVTVVYTPKGVTRQLFEEALSRFPAPGQIIGKTKGSR
jgi:magnesium-dependent phosphatase 1